MDSHSRKRRAGSPPTDPPPSVQMKKKLTDRLPLSETIAVIEEKLSRMEVENIWDDKRKRDASSDAEEPKLTPQLQILDVSENKGAKMPTLAGMVRPVKMREFTVKVRKKLMETGVDTLPTSETAAVIKGKLPNPVKKRKRDASSDSEEPTLRPQTKKLKALDEEEKKTPPLPGTARPGKMRKSTARVTEFRPPNEPPSRFITIPEVSNPGSSALGENPTEPRIVFKLNDFYVIACTPERDSVARLVGLRVNVDGYCFRFLTHQVNECFYMPLDAESAWYPRSAVKRRLIEKNLRTDSQGIIRVAFDFQVLLQYNILP